MNDVDLAWVAGLLEGEGCFYLGRRKNKDGTPRPLVSVTCTMTDQDVIYRLHQLIGTGNVTRREARQENWRTSWTWTDARVDNVGPLIALLYPLMGTRRQAKISSMLAAIEGWARRPVTTHGTRSMYVAGCRCAPCKKAHAVYMREYKAARRQLLDELT